MKLFGETGWWSNMTSSFVGALLGILITFGTSSYIEYRDKQEMMRKTTLMTIHNIDRYIISMEEEVQGLCQRDSVFQFILSRYPKQLHQVSKDTLELFLNSLNHINFFALDSSAEGIFTHSIDVWKNVENTLVIEGIGDCFAIKNMFVSHYEHIRDTRREIFLDFCSKKFVTDYKTPALVVRAFLDNPRARYFVAEYGLHVFLLGKCTEGLKALSQRNKEMISVTEEELLAMETDFEWEAKEDDTKFVIKKK